MDVNMNLSVISINNQSTNLIKLIESVVDISLLPFKSFIQRYKIRECSSSFLFLNEKLFKHLNV